MKENKWELEPSSSPVHGISKDPNLFAFSLNILRERCKKLCSVEPSMVECPQFYKAVMFARHPEKILSTACNFKLETTTAFKHLKVQLGADTDDLAEDDIDSLSDAEYDCERRQIRRLDTKKLMVKYVRLAPRLIADVPQTSGEASRIGCSSRNQFSSKKREGPSSARREIRQTRKDDRGFRE
ncbi:hypothetical protein GQ600_5549 [Phytophthora cactorum]|nr:hypothetical protein GQ600_5549 [Phytophthora cactorum]